MKHERNVAFQWSSRIIPRRSKQIYKSRMTKFSKNLEKIIIDSKTFDYILRRKIIDCKRRTFMRQAVIKTVVTGYSPLEMNSFMATKIH